MRIGGQRRARSGLIHGAVLALVLFTTGRSLRAGLEFTAMIELGGVPRFAFTDPDRRESSGWLTVGQAFHGYVVMGYDAQREVVQVRRSGAFLELPLKSQHVTAATARVPPELAARGISTADLLVRESGLVRIKLSVGATASRRFIDVHFDNGTDRCAVEFGREGPQKISRALLPEAVREFVTDDDIGAINACLSAVGAKWLPDVAPTATGSNGTGASAEIPSDGP